MSENKCDNFKNNFLPQGRGFKVHLLNTGLLYRTKSTLYNAICCRVEAEPAQLHSPVSQKSMTLIRATSDRVTLKAMIFKAGVATEAKACSRDTSSSTGACGRSTQPSCPSQEQSSILKVLRSPS